MERQGAALLTPFVWWAAATPSYFGAIGSGHWCLSTCGVVQMEQTCPSKQPPCEGWLRRGRICALHLSPLAGSGWRSDPTHSTSSCSWGAAEGTMVRPPPLSAREGADPPFHPGMEDLSPSGSSPWVAQPRGSGWVDPFPILFNFFSQYFFFV